MSVKLNPFVAGLHGKQKWFEPAPGFSSAFGDVVFLNDCSFWLIPINEKQPKSKGLIIY